MSKSRKNYTKSSTNRPYLKEPTHKPLSVLSIDNPHYLKLVNQGRANFDYNASQFEEVGDSYQSAWEKILYTAGNFNLNTVAGVLDGIGAWDVQDLSNVATGEAPTGNWATELADEVREKTGYIYGDKTSPLSVNYWVNQIGNLGYSAGLMAEGLLEHALLDVITGGASAPALASKNIATAGKAIATATLKKGLKKAAHTGLSAFSGVRETLINASDTWEGVYQELLEKGYSEEEAEKMASQVATRSFYTELAPTMALNVLQFGLLRSRNFGVSGSVETLFEKIAPKAGKGTKFATQVVSEGIEEGYQSFASSYGRGSVLQEQGVIDDYQIFNQEMFDSVVGGVLGGGVFGGVGMAMDKYRNRRYRQQRRRIIDKITFDIGERLKKGEDVDNLARENLFNILRTDNVTKKDDVFNFYISVLEKDKEANEHLIKEAHEIKEQYNKGQKGYLGYRQALVEDELKSVIRKKDKQQLKFSEKRILDTVHMSPLEMEYYDMYLNSIINSTQNDPVQKQRLEEVEQKIKNKGLEVSFNEDTLNLVNDIASLQVRQKDLMQQLSVYQNKRIDKKFIDEHFDEIHFEELEELVGLVDDETSVYIKELLLPFQNKKKDKYILNPQRLTLAKDIDAPGNFTIYMDSLKQERFKDFDEVPLYGAYIDMYRHGVEKPFLVLIKHELSKEKVKEEAKKRAKETKSNPEEEIKKTTKGITFRNTTIRKAL